MNKKSFTIIFIILAVLAVSTALFFYFHTGKNIDSAIKEAGKSGKKTEMKLLVQIAPSPPGSSSKSDERFERGDIVLTAPAKAEFSRAEKEGFLIIKVKINEKQAALIIAGFETEKTDISKDSEEKEAVPPAEKSPRRRYAVDLAKIGLAPEDFHGREITDKVFGEEVIILK